MTTNVLVIDDDESIREGCTQTLVEEGYRARAAHDGHTGLALAARESFDLVVLDLKMPRLDGFQVLERLRRDSPNTAVVVITGYGSIESAVQAVRNGAFDYLPKPFTPEVLANVVRRAVEHRRLVMESQCLRSAVREHLGHSALVGKSPAMAELDRLVRKVAPTDATVLLVGETGVGKELVARTLHQHSDRRDGPFVAVDCASLVEGLFESEMFGHARGAYTGATETTIGKFEQAQGGTLFLDEIGNVSRNAQAKLLRAIQEREVVKVGSAKRVRVDVRIVAATNNDLLQDIRRGTFRQDLFFRLSVVPIRVPPLRDRGTDIELLAEHFLRRHRARRNPRVARFSEAALLALRAYDWPGNVRELENTVERALVMSEGESIDAQDLFFYGTPLMPAPAEDAPVIGEGDPGTLAQAERREIERVLHACDWQQTRAAAQLGISRKTLREKIRRYEIARPEV